MIKYSATLWGYLFLALFTGCMHDLSFEPNEPPRGMIIVHVVDSVGNAVPNVRVSLHPEPGTPSLGGTKTTGREGTVSFDSLLIWHDDRRSMWSAYISPAGYYSYALHTQYYILQGSGTRTFVGIENVQINSIPLNITIQIPNGARL